ncbi:Aldehyde/histidinol dehydrogenase [Ephemerocybe angulata]|uniref:Aldehyde dehydrogenase n=1 Tax=Ephemerocybe angulata TaxID=980116 RepID=A0A8H6MDT1_9AGAR|nr:Aldehyde/histidinol dehydrogenase [Tulosesus angulatus]
MSTPLSEINEIHAALSSTFLTSLSAHIEPSPSTTSTGYPLLSLAYRQHQLLQLARLVQENADALCNSLWIDEGKPRQEVVMAEIGAVIGRALRSAKELESWVGGGEEIGEDVKLEGWQEGWKARVDKKAKGVVLIISPWNYPIILTFQPLCGAIAAGCPALIKPSEVVPTFSKLLAELVPKYLDPAAYRVALGGIPEITKILELKWAHIFYTGNGRVARIISAAAAKHLTPMTLELGGKSPVIIDGANLGEGVLEVAARRVVWGKVNNAGQICVAPDYVLIEPAYIPAFIEACRTALESFFPEGALNSADYGRIVSEAHFARVKGLLRDTKGKVVIGGGALDGSEGQEGARARGVEPTVVVLDEATAADDVLLQDELFAPILPIFPVASVAAALEYVRAHEHPLVIYAFTESESVKREVKAGTMSGNVVFNDTFNQLSVDDIPFGGVGESGYGRQPLKWTFEEFVYLRSVVEVPFSEEPKFGGRYPPSSKETLDFFEGCLKIPIPSVEELGRKVNGVNGVNGATKV